MPAQRKTFRIEETMQAGEPDEARAQDSGMVPSAVIAELRALRTLIERHLSGSAEKPAAPDNTQQEVRRLKIELDVIGSAIKQTRSEILSLQDQGFDSSRVARVAKELEAVFNDTSVATDTILKAAEDIDQQAQALITQLKGSHEQRLAQDIQDAATAIFEACNFHDLTGQRLSKMAATVKMVEEHLARMMEIWSVIDRFDVLAAQSSDSETEALVNGPKLEGDDGHSTQDEIDKLFH
jgi:chemotaxis protein CheZ